ncbi:MAG: serine hydrolase [Gemmatimonadota bacterium]
MVSLVLALSLSLAHRQLELPHTPLPVAALVRADSVVRDWVGQGPVPGAVLLVEQDGRVLLQRAYGVARSLEYDAGEYGAAAAGVRRGNALRHLAEPMPMTVATRFDLASVTKVMATTFAVMILVDEGTLDLERPVVTWLPDFRGEGRERITVEHLLTHRSGLPQWLPVYYHASDPEGAWAFVRGVPLAWAVGEGRHYSDLGFMVLGRLVEQVSGQPLDAFLRERLARPLGLRSTGFRPRGTSAEAGVASTSHGNPYEHRMVHDSTFGYRIEGDPDAWDDWRTYTLTGEVNDGNAWHAWGGVAGHAGLFSTAADLGSLLQLLLDGGLRRGRRLISQATVRRFLDPIVDGQALGWQVPAYAPAGSFTHSGFTGTWVLGVPERGLGVVLLTNRQHGGVTAEGVYPDVGPLQRSVADALLAGGR